MRQPTYLCDGTLGDHIRAMCARIGEREPALMALLPEEDREGRLLREAAELESRFPAIAGRPPLYGLLLFTGSSPGRGRSSPRSCSPRQTKRDA